MMFSFIMLLWFVVILKVVNASHDKLSALELLAQRGSSNVVELDDATYGGFVTDDRSRPYKLLVLLTASHPKFKCAICKQVESNFRTLASSYAAHVTAGGSSVQDVPIFFVKIDYAVASKTFSQYSINSVPVIFYLGEQHGLDGSPFDVGMRDRFAAGQMEQDVDALAGFLATKSGVHFKIYKPMWMSYIYLICFFGLALAVVRAVIVNLEFYVGIIQIKSIWMTISLGLYVCAISGLIFDIIRSPPMYQRDPRSGKVVYFYPHQGSQFVVEGFIVGFLNLICGGALYFLGVVAPTCSKDVGKRTTLMVISSAAFAVCFYMIRGFYRVKNGWYNF